MGSYKYGYKSPFVWVIAIVTLLITLLITTQVGDLGFRFRGIHLGRENRTGNC